MNKYSLGMRGQDAARTFLMQKGIEIIRENYRLRSAEIDIIARDEGFIVFVEVRFRGGTTYGLPRESVGRKKQKRIISAAMHYISVNNMSSQNFRFDVVEVVEQGGRMFVNHIIDAFWA